MVLFSKKQEQIEMSKRILNIKLDNVAELLNYHKNNMSSPLVKEREVNRAVRSLEKLLDSTDFIFDKESINKISILTKELQRFSMINLGEMDKFTFDERINRMLNLIKDLKKNNV